jgi:hypothetical protein
VQTPSEQGTSMIEIKQPEPSPLVNELLMEILKINEQIVRQNALIAQAMTLPALIVKGDKHE